MSKIVKSVITSKNYARPHINDEYCELDIDSSQYDEVQGRCYLEIYGSNATGTFKFTPSSDVIKSYNKECFSIDSTGTILTLKPNLQTKIFTDAVILINNWNWTNSNITNCVLVYPGYAYYTDANFVFDLKIDKTDAYLTAQFYTADSILKYDKTYFNIDSTDTILTLKQDAYSFTATSGSLKGAFNDSEGNPIDTFPIIDGDLDTNTSGDGNYADIVIPIIFTKLRNFRYDNSIFDNIRNNLAEFFSSIALKKRIVKRIELLNEEFLSGKITLDEFNELVKEGNKEFSDVYGIDYTDNFVKLQNAIEIFKPFLEIEN